MKDVCLDVEFEPKLEPLEDEFFDNRTTTKEEDTRVDIKANCVWETSFNGKILDVKVFNPHAKPCTRTIKAASKHQ